MLAQTYRQYLEGKGYQVDVAGTAQKAIELIDAHASDAIVLELQLAGHNGIEFLHELRSYVEWQHIPVIVHTLLPVERLKKYQSNWQAFGISQLHSKSDTTLAELGKYVQAATV